MIWLITGAALVGYQVVALRLDRPRVSYLAHHWPWGVFVWAWIVTFAWHLIDEWRKEVVR